MPENTAIQTDGGGKDVHRRIEPDAASDGARESGATVIERHFLNGCAVLVVTLMLGIVAQVVCSLLDLNPLAEFSSTWPLVGDAITLNSLLDAQWHLLAIIALAPAWLVWRRDGHVRVDFLFNAMGPKSRATVDLVGHLLFTGPFLIMATPAAWSFMAGAFRSGQGSNNSGLNDLFLIKAVLPIGLALLALVALVDIVLLIRRLARR